MHTGCRYPSPWGPGYPGYGPSNGYTGMEFLARGHGNGDQRQTWNTVTVRSEYRYLARGTVAIPRNSKLGRNKWLEL
eukprot:3173291-Rhodomonas_salina.1